MVFRCLWHSRSRLNGYHRHIQLSCSASATAMPSGLADVAASIAVLVPLRLANDFGAVGVQECRSRFWAGPVGSSGFPPEGRHSCQGPSSGAPEAERARRPFHHVQPETGLERRRRRRDGRLSCISPPPTKSTMPPSVRLWTEAFVSDSAVPAGA